jgi:hypothetical protein
MTATSATRKVVVGEVRIGYVVEVKAGGKLLEERKEVL